LEHALAQLVDREATIGSAIGLIDLVKTEVHVTWAAPVVDADDGPGAWEAMCAMRDSDPKREYLSTPQKHLLLE
jgi:hypothetical protein